MMRAPARLAPSLAVAKKVTIEEWFSDYGLSGRTDSGVIVNQTTAMRVATVMACVRVCSEDVAKLPPRVYRLLGTDGARREAKDHFLYRLFRKPNAWQT